MDAFNEIISRLEKQKEAIEKALGALRDMGGGGAATPAPPPVKRAYTRKASTKKAGGISEEGRLRLAEAMKKRWAVKRAGTTVKKTSRKKSAK